MIIKTKILCVSIDEATEKRTSWWDEFEFNLDHYVCHAFDEDGSCLHLAGLNYPMVIKLTFDELSELLKKRYSFETIALN